MEASLGKRCLEQREHSEKMNVSQTEVMVNSLPPTLKADA